jgi:hypothetical protein
MALIKGKQIESIIASQVIETDDKKFVSQAEKDEWNNNSGNGLTDEILAKINKADELKHSHDNKEIIDKFSLVDGVLLFDGKEIEGSAGEPGQDGKSAYDIWLEEGNTGTVEKFLQSLIGPQGNTGNDGNSIELRKTATSIEWRQVPHKIITADFNASKTMMTAKSSDILEKVVINSFPRKAKYAQIKTITVYGADKDGKDLINSNPSISTAPPGVTFPEFGGFDPVTSEKIDLTINPEIIGNASIKTIMETYLPDLQKYNPEVTHVNKFCLWVHFLDENNEDIKFVTAYCHITDSRTGTKTIDVDSEWKELIPLAAITGKDGEQGPQGPQGEIPNIDHLATKEYVTEAINKINGNNHSHTNKEDVLDKLSVVDGKLNFDNIPIQSEIASINTSDIQEYAASLINGEEQLLITREDGSIYFTNGKGSYIQCGVSKEKYDKLEQRLIELENIIKAAN